MTSYASTLQKRDYLKYLVEAICDRSASEYFLDHTKDADSVIMYSEIACGRADISVKEAEAVRNCCIAIKNYDGNTAQNDYFYIVKDALDKILEEE